MYTIVIDTSSKKSILSVVYEGMVIDHQSFDPINDVINYKVFSEFEINDVVVGIGPGSHMGTRIGLVTAQFFAYIKKLDIKSVCSLKALLPSDIESNVDFACIYSARGAGFYFLNGKVTGNRTIEWGSVEIFSKENVEDISKHCKYVFCTEMYIDLPNHKIVNLDPISMIKFANQNLNKFDCDNLFVGLKPDYMSGSRSSALYDV